jgi:dTDP-4-dehydrorhamnose reductase
MKTKVLITGANGQLGCTLKKLSSNYDDIEFFFVTKSQLNITDKNSLESFFENHNFQYCINCAAYTNVDQAEIDKDLAFQINANAVKNLAITCKKFNVVLIHISTDFVFDGTKKEPYKETDIPNPINVYGESKLKGEQYIQSILKRFFILRTSWLYSEYGNNFVKTILRLTRKNKELRVVNDQIGSPTYAQDLAEVILEIIDSKNSQYGLYHYSNQGAISWFDFSMAIFNFANISIQVTPIPTSSYPTLAKRPSFSSLNLENSKEKLNIVIPNWEVSLKGVIKKII